MKISGWGRNIRVDSTPVVAGNISALSQAVTAHSGMTDTAAMIAFGNGRSYGDSALADHHVVMRRWNRMLAFDASRGLLECEAGVMLQDILNVFLPKGWFLKITPGTKLITVGGAIASDVHGKNHHVDGCFSECVEYFDLILADGSLKRCSKESNSELFHATCGGMGLTGIIVQAGIQLKAVASRFIRQTTVKTKNLEETLTAFEKYAHIPYSVAWIDCLTRGQSMGRSILTVGDFDNDGDLDYREKKGLSIPCNFPSFSLNSLSVRAFNTLYYGKAKKGISEDRVPVDTFFYPLDALRNWNRIYGKNGFVQYQFILPREKSAEGLSVILDNICRSGMGSFLAVLKLYGRQNSNYLSFPLEGYSLALDFKMQKGLPQLLSSLDTLVTRFGGRINLTKDSVCSRSDFEAGYPMAPAFRELRRELGLDKVFNSLQSRRLGL